MTEATRELATGRTGEALGRYEQAGAVHRHATLDEGKAALLAEWEAERRARPGDSRIMLAHTRADVRDLNERARKLREDAGETYWGVTMPTENGERRFSVGDEVLFGRNDRGLGVKNGTRGKVDFISGIHGDHVLEILVPEPGGDDRLVKVRLADYGHLDHGYAATVHKTQGVTVDRVHVLATSGMDRHMAYVALTRHRDGVALHWSADELGSREGLERTLSRERLKDTSLDYGEGEAAAESDAEPMRAFAERRGLHPRIPVSQIVVRAGQVAARSLVSLSTLARRKVEQQALAGGLQPMLGLLREQKQLFDRLLERVARDPKPAASSERPSSAAALRGPGALSLALGALAQRRAQSLPPPLPLQPPKPYTPASLASTASACADDDAAMRQELTLALIVASTPGREAEGDRLLQRRSDIAWRSMRHELQLAMDRQPLVLTRADTISGTVEAADAATRQRQTATVIRQEHYKRWDADEKALEATLRRSREQTAVHALSPQAQVALDRLAAAARTVTLERLHDWKWRGERFGHVGSLRAQLRAERAPVLEAWAAIAADPVIAAELVRREATLRHRWTEDFLRGSAAASMRGSGSRALQDPAYRLAAEAILIGYAWGVTATEQAWQAKPVKTMEPDARTAADWAMSEPRPRPTWRPSPSSGPSMR